MHEKESSKKTSGTHYIWVCWYGLVGLKPPTLTLTVKCFNLLAKQLHTHTPSFLPSLSCMHSKETTQSRSGTGCVFESPWSGSAVTFVVVIPLDTNGAGAVLAYCKMRLSVFLVCMVHQACLICCYKRAP